MEKQKKRAVIKYLHMKGMSPWEILIDIMTTVLNIQPLRIKRGRTITEDDPRSGRPKMQQPIFKLCCTMYDDEYCMDKFGVSPIHLSFI